ASTGRAGYGGKMAGAGYGQRIEDEGIDDREHCGVRADAEAHGHYNKGDEHRALAHGAKSVAEVAKEIVEQVNAPGVARWRWVVLWQAVTRIGRTERM